RTHAKGRKVAAGETLLTPNRQCLQFLVVVGATLEILRVGDEAGEGFGVCGPGMFTRELSVLSGRRGLVHIRAAEAGELIEIEREALLAMVQTDSELSDIFLRAFILRRLELIARGIGDLVLIGSSHSLDT